MGNQSCFKSTTTKKDESSSPSQRIQTRASSNEENQVQSYGTQNSSVPTIRQCSLSGKIQKNNVDVGMGVNSIELQIGDLYIGLAFIEIDDCYKDLYKPLPNGEVVKFSLQSLSDIIMAKTCSFKANGKHCKVKNFRNCPEIQNSEVIIEVTKASKVQVLEFWPNQKDSLPLPHFVIYLENDFDLYVECEKNKVLTANHCIVECWPCNGSFEIQLRFWDSLDHYKELYKTMKNGYDLIQQVKAEPYVVTTGLQAIKTLFQNIQGRSLSFGPLLNKEKNFTKPLTALGYCKKNPHKRINCIQFIRAAADSFKFKIPNSFIDTYISKAQKNIVKLPDKDWKDWFKDRNLWNYA